MPYFSRMVAQPYNPNLTHYPSTLSPPLRLPFSSSRPTFVIFLTFNSNLAIFTLPIYIFIYPQIIVFYLLLCSNPCRLFDDVRRLKKSEWKKKKKASVINISAIVFYSSILVGGWKKKISTCIIVDIKINLLLHDSAYGSK